MDATIITAIIGAISLAFGTLITYITTRGKATADSALVYAQAAKLSVDTQNALQGQLTAMQTRLNERDIVIDSLNAKLMEMKGEAAEKDRKIFDLQLTVQQQEHTIEKMRQEITALKGLA